MILMLLACASDPAPRPEPEPESGFELTQDSPYYGGPRFIDQILGSCDDDTAMLDVFVAGGTNVHGNRVDLVHSEDFRLATYPMTVRAASPSRAWTHLRATIPPHEAFPCQGIIGRNTDNPIVIIRVYGVSGGATQLLDCVSWGYDPDGLIDGNFDAGLDDPEEIPRCHYGVLPR